MVQAKEQLVFCPIKQGGAEKWLMRGLCLAGACLVVLTLVLLTLFIDHSKKISSLIAPILFKSSSIIYVESESL